MNKKIEEIFNYMITDDQLDELNSNITNDNNVIYSYLDYEDDKDISEFYSNINLSAEFRNELMSRIKSKYNSLEEAILDNELKGNVATVEMIKRDANNG